MPAKLTAGPTPDGGFISRRTDNEYTFAVAILDTTERTYRPRDPQAENGYVPNPTLNKWVSLSWHSRYDLAVKRAEQSRSHGNRVVVVPVVQ